MDRLELSKNYPLRIGTHSEVFHCDEVLACFMLLQLDEFANSRIIRTREQRLLSECDIVVDVGGVYDKSIHRYDHHQRDFEHTLSSLRPELGKQWTIRLSSAGLIYAHFGERILQAIYKKNTGRTISDEALKVIYLKIYENFIQEIDAIDNGIPMYEGEPLYRITTNLSSRIANFNPQWNCIETESQYELFKSAMSYAGNELEDRILYYVNSWWPARKLVEECLAERHQVHASEEIMELKGQFPWKEHLFDLESVQKIEGKLKFVIFQTYDVWRVQAIPVQPKSFVVRQPLQPKWWGYRDEKLDEVSGISGCIFCHSTGFIGGNKTREGALKMALESLVA
uniref:Uncharacterized protein n=1 Tax=Xenopsylla cheopis TaxID=163159 RepID=A0A6M2DKM9_XENCH